MLNSKESTFLKKIFSIYRISYLLKLTISLLDEKANATSSTRYKITTILSKLIIKKET